MCKPLILFLHYWHCLKLYQKTNGLGWVIYYCQALTNNKGHCYIPSLEVNFSCFLTKGFEFHINPFPPRGFPLTSKIVWRKITKGPVLAGLGGSGLKQVNIFGIVNFFRAWCIFQCPWFFGRCLVGNVGCQNMSALPKCCSFNLSGKILFGVFKMVGNLPVQ